MRIITTKLHSNTARNCFVELALAHLFKGPLHGGTSGSLLRKCDGARAFVDAAAAGVEFERRQSDAVDADVAGVAVVERQTHTDRVHLKHMKS